MTKQNWEVEKREKVNNMSHEQMNLMGIETSNNKHYLFGKATKIFLGKTLPQGV